MLTINDFERGDDRYTDYIAECTLCGKRIAADASFESELGKTEQTLAAALPAINEKLGFIEESFGAIADSAVEAGLDELAEEWLGELAEDEGSKEVTLEDGSTVPAEVTPESFKASLYPVAAGFEFTESTERCVAYLELLCDPDYFAGHRIHIEIDEENEISCEGI